MRYVLTIEDTITYARSAQVTVEAKNRREAMKMADAMIGNGTYPAGVVSGETAGESIEYAEEQIDNTPWDITVETERQNHKRGLDS